ncbi:MAG: efflux RND transporter periplasmic adaptor subunit [Candidatus Omnitrophica bacterium]|nr:efflux RND transporter periplasmic adaptor subunit [Candidatus Omnitrophota bacterium]MDD5771712.1 efflux RND transporter periplasmic adaptor subunit [Candidatus Omnitrophota bacterium]
MFNKTNLLLCSILFFVSLALTGCQDKSRLVPEKEVIPVRVNKVELQSIKNTFDYVDDIKAQDEAVIYPKVNGKIIEKIKEEGDRVRRGDVVAYIDRDEVGFKFEKAPVESPLTGIIGRTYVDKGTSVTPQTPIALVVDMDKVKIDIDITEENIPKIALGQEAEITLQSYPGEKFTGVVSKISPVLDLDTRTAPIEIVIPNPDHRLKSGMFARVQLIMEEHKNVPVIIKEAIMGRGNDNYVYLIKDNKAYQKDVKLGIRQGAYYEVTDGLQDGDLVVVMGQQKLYNGVAVMVEEGR